VFGDGRAVVARKQREGPFQRHDSPILLRSTAKAVAWQPGAGVSKVSTLIDWPPEGAAKSFFREPHSSLFSFTSRQSPPQVEADNINAELVDEEDYCWSQDSKRYRVRIEICRNIDEKEMADSSELGSGRRDI
jgi:hypothetical protein